MLVALILSAIDSALGSIVIRSQALDFHLEENNFVKAFASFAMSVNNFVPVVDGLLPILSLSILLTLFGATTKALRYVVNLVRGAGA
jgi:hypothetical protein